MKTKPKPAPPPTKFTEALQEIYYDNGWVFPPAHTVAIYEERIRQLEAEIDVLTGGRSKAAKRIDPMEERRMPS